MIEDTRIPIILCIFLFFIGYWIYTEYRETMNGNRRKRK